MSIQRYAGLCRDILHVSFCALMLLGALAMSAHAQGFTVLHTFTGQGDGWGPYTGLTIDNGGNLYGTTAEFNVDYGGTVFQLKPHNGSWTFTTLSNTFGGGRNPFGRPVMGPGGALYGTTYYGGSGSCTELGCGTVYSLRPPQTFCRGVTCPWTATLVYSFNGNDGLSPAAVEPVFDSAGNMYGTTTEGGSSGVGNVFELTKSNGQWTGTNLHVFSGPDGEYPQSSITLDAHGSLYGTAYLGGPNNRGTVWQLTNIGARWVFAVLYDFPDVSDGNGPVGAPIFDSAGNMYAATFSGGANGGGTVFELSPSEGSWHFTLLYSFSGGGYNPGPLDSLTMDAAGNLYGTTNLDGAHGCGSVFKLTRNDGSWTFSDLYDFTCGADGANPFGGVALDAQGNLYGTTSAGGDAQCMPGGCGVVWEITQ